MLLVATVEVEVQGDGCEGEVGVVLQGGLGAGGQLVALDGGGCGAAVEARSEEEQGDYVVVARH